MDFLAGAIENADEERSDAWYLRDTSKGLRLMTARLLACEVGRSKMRVSVIGPVADEVRAALGSDPEADEEFKLVPGTLLITFPVEHASRAQDLLSDGFNSFVDLAMARVRRRVSLEDHVPEAVTYVASVVGRELPQPEHALPLGWESMEYEEFLRERRRRMADIIRVAFRQLGGEQDAPPVTPPWFLPGAETVWQRIGETERALRTAVREVYVLRFGDSAAARIEAAVPEGDRQTFARNLARRPAGSEPLSVVDYLYLGQLTPILFALDVQQEARSRFSGAQDPKQRLLAAVGQIAPVRNEIAHVREIDPDRLLRASVACADVLDTLKGSQVRKDATNG